MAGKSKSKLSTKLEAIKIIVKELDKFNEEDRMHIIDFVLKQLGIRQSSLRVKDIKTEEREVLPKTIIGIDKFVKEKKPKDQYQRVAVLAHYLKHHQEVNDFKNKIIGEANLKARQPEIGNLADVISKAETRYSFLTKGIKMGRQLTTLGEDVVEALPDQDKVKAMIKASKGRKKRKRRKKRKKSKKKQTIRR